MEKIMEHKKQESQAEHAFRVLTDRQRATRLKLVGQAVRRAKDHEREGLEAIDWLPKKNQEVQLEAICHDRADADFFWLVAVVRFLYACS